MTEEWKQIPGHPGYYASNTGRLKRVLGGVERIIHSHATTKYGHQQATLRIGNQRCWRYVHRLVLETFVGPCPDGMEACHGDGNPLNNRVENLRWDTRINNFADRDRHGNTPRGTRSGMSKLNDDLVSRIRERYAAGIGATFLAEEFSVSRSLVYQIVSMKIWRHVA